MIEKKSWVKRLMSPLMNQRGEVVIDPGADPNIGTGTGEGDDLGIGGTGFKSPEELASGYQSLMKKLGEQGNELGTLRKEKETLSGHADTLTNILKEQMGKTTPMSQTPIAVDYDKQLTDIETEIQGLDPMAADYSRSLSSLVMKSNRLAALSQHEKTLSAAGDLMKKELGARDTKAAQDMFHKENPTFKTPEMQTKIKEYLSKDQTGMHDPMSAYFQIQRDELMMTTKQLSKENADMRKLVELNKGKGEAGKVVVKSQGIVPKVTPTKVTGKDLDAGMRAVLEAQNTG